MSGNPISGGPLIKRNSNKKINYFNNPKEGFYLSDSNGDSIKLGAEYKVDESIQDIKFVIKNTGNIPAELRGFPQVILQDTILPSGLRPDGARGKRESGQSCFLDFCVLSRGQPTRLVLMPGETNVFTITRVGNGSGEFFVNIPRTVWVGDKKKKKIFKPFWFKLIY